MRIARLAVCALLVPLIGCDSGGRNGTGRPDAGVTNTGQPDGGGITCSPGQVTTLTGKVFAPNGTLPIYNAIVSIPTTPLEPFPTGVDDAIANMRVIDACYAAAGLPRREPASAFDG